jgi:hypothetical protein
MPKRIARLDKQFSDLQASALGLSEAGEMARLQANKVFHYKHLEFMYESAYLRIFCAWEVFLEESLLRVMCGHLLLSGSRPNPTASYFSKLSTAKNHLYSQFSPRGYLLWHNPMDVETRAKHYLIASGHERTCNASRSPLRHYASIRHAIAHRSTDAVNKFNTATMNLSGRHISGSRPGAFLRSRDTLTGHRWIKRISDELSALSTHIIS